MWLGGSSRPLQVAFTPRLDRAQKQSANDDFGCTPRLVHKCRKHRQKTQQPPSARVCWQPLARARASAHHGGRRPERVYFVERALYKRHSPEMIVGCQHRLTDKRGVFRCHLRDPPSCLLALGVEVFDLQIGSSCLRSSNVPRQQHTCIVGPWQ